MTFRSWPSCGSATSTRVVLEPMSIAAHSITKESARSSQTVRMRPRIVPPGHRDQYCTLRRRLGLDELSVGMRGVLEFTEQPGDNEGDLLANVDGVVADPLDRPRDEQHRHRPLAAV